MADLQKQYDDIQGGGSTFVSAKIGSNRQSVQLADLDADGENEVIAFFKATAWKQEQYNTYKNNFSHIIYSITDLIKWKEKNCKFLAVFYFF